MLEEPERNLVENAGLATEAVRRCFARAPGREERVVGWIIGLLVLVCGAWVVAICYEIARPGRLNEPAVLVGPAKAG